MDTSGFYKLSDGVLLHAPNAVFNKDYTLSRDSNSDYTYPVDGWYWYNSREEACMFFNYKDLETEDQPCAK